METCNAHGCTETAWTKPDKSQESVASRMWRSPTGSITHSFPSKAISSKLCFFHNMLEEQKLWNEEKEVERDSKKVKQPRTVSLRSP